MKNNISVLILGDDTIDKYLVETYLSISDIEVVKSFKNPVEAFSYLLNTNNLPSHILIDVGESFVTSLEILRKINMLDIQIQNIKIFFLYNSSDIIDEFIHHITYEFIYEKIKVDFIEKPISKEKIKQYILNNNS